MKSSERVIASETESVDSVLREYLSKPTVPRMEAVHLEAPAAEKLPEVPLASGQAATPATNLDDERPTGRWSIPSESNAAAHVRDRGVLVRIDGESSGEVVSLPRSPMLVGRSSAVQVHIAEVSVSREHARILYEEGVYCVEDLGSLNGTEVNGRRVTRARLHDGTLLQVGQRARFRFQLMDAAQEEVLRRLYDSSMRDPLTGVDNRRSLDGRLVSEIAFARRHKRPLSVVLLDIDFFKRINDRHGHPAGDEVLRTVAATVKSKLRTEDVFARYGGEEFVALLRDTALREAIHVAERVRECIATTVIRLGEDSLLVTVSAGCSSLACCTGTSPEELIGVADRRLYQAKRAGRNRVVGNDDVA